MLDNSYRRNRSPIGELHNIILGIVHIWTRTLSQTPTTLVSANDDTLHVYNTHTRTHILYTDRLRWCSDAAWSSSSAAYVLILFRAFDPESIKRRLVMIHTRTRTHTHKAMTSCRFRVGNDRELAKVSRGGTK